MHPLVEKVFEYRRNRDLNWNDDTIRIALQFTHGQSSAQIDEIFKEVMQAAVIEQIEEKSAVTVIDAPAVIVSPAREWEMPDHKDVDLATTNPEDLGLDPTFNDDNVALNDAIAEAKRKAETSAPADTPVATFDPLPAFPAVFKTFPNWVTYKSKLKTEKAPIVSGTFNLAESDNPATWVDYATLCANIKAGKGYSNPGFVTDGERTGHLTGIDIDGCKTHTGIQEWVKPVLNTVGPSYTEWTPNRGLRIWVQADFSKHGRKNKYLMSSAPGFGGKAQKVEIFGDGLYFTVTGDKFPESANEVAKLSDEQVLKLLDLLSGMEVAKPDDKKETKSKRTKAVAQPDGSLKFEPIPPDPAFKVLFEKVGWAPMEARMGKMSDARFNNLQMKPGKMIYCPMPGHQPRSQDLSYSMCFNVIPEHDAAVCHCFGCDFSGDMVSTVREFDAGEDGGKIVYPTMYDCARAICREQGLNPDEYFPQVEAQSLVMSADVVGKLHEASQEVIPEVDRVSGPFSRISIAEIRQKIDEVLQGRQLPWTHRATADLFDVLFGENYYYATTGKNADWVMWNGHIWHQGNTTTIQRKIDAFLKKVRFEIIPNLRLSDEKAVEIFQGLDKKCASSEFMNGVLKMLQVKRSIDLVQFDPKDNPPLLNFLNGTYELQTGIFRESRRDDMQTQTMAVTYIAGTECPTWIQFLSNSFPEVETREFLQRFFGYMLEGTGNKKFALFLHGYGDNGKSALLSVLMALFGYESNSSYGKAASWDSFAENKNGAIRNDIARLFNARAVFCDESEQGMILKESMFKALTGMSPITTRFMFKEFFTFLARFVFVLATNRMPRVIGGDSATWSRILKVPMTESFPPGHPKRIENLNAVLMREREGIAQWLIEGYRKYKAEGLKIPQTVLDASAEYRENSDATEWFLTEVLEKTENAHERFETIYFRYCSWCKTKNEKEQTRDGLIDVLKSHGYKVERVSQAGRPLYVRNVRLLPNENFGNSVSFEVAHK